MKAFLTMDPLLLPNDGAVMVAAGKDYTWVSAP